uniref:Uncharacterized protein n=1 Tax=Arundo donax TaxID=35708 RepID=A0A0A9EV33_ARUDO
MNAFFFLHTSTLDADISSLFLNYNVFIVPSVERLFVLTILSMTSAISPFLSACC